jgi:hypothetical protein
MTERKTAGLYVFLLLAWWGCWLALDAWRIEHLLTDADKWPSFRRDILCCVVSSAISVVFLMMNYEKKLAVYGLLGCLALIVAIPTAIVVGDAFIHWKLDMSLFSIAISGAGLAMAVILPFVTFLMARS